MVTSCNNTDFGYRARHISIQDHFTEVRSRPEPKAVGILSDLAALFVDLFRMWLSGRGKQTHAFESQRKVHSLYLHPRLGTLLPFEC